MPDLADSALARKVAELEYQNAILCAELTSFQTSAPGAGNDQSLRAAGGDIAHDFNNLLGIIIANLDLLREQPASSTAGILLHEALGAALRGVELVRQMALTNQPIRPRGVMAGDTESESVAGDSGGETILVVDDNADMRRAVVRQLSEFGYRVLEAEDGPAALMILNGESVNLLFTDVVMPGGLSGYDLARLVLARWPSMRALITTGYPELEPLGDSASQAKLRRLPKPYRTPELARTLREVLDGQVPQIVS